MKYDEETGLAFPKNPREKAPYYLRWMGGQVCVVSEQSGAIPHHGKWKGNGGTAYKSSDFMTLPLIAKYHDYESPEGFHRNPKEWERLHGPQTMHIRRQLNQAFSEGVITIKIRNKYLKKCDELDLKNL